MAKKLILIIVFLFVIFVICNVETEICTKEEAISIAQVYVKANNKEKFVNTITNFDSPKVEVVYIDRLVTHNEGKENVIRDKECYKVIFAYPLDLFAGPYDVYINYSTGKCYGSPSKC